MIRNYNDKYEPKAMMFAYAYICVEVNIGKGLQDVVQLCIGNWTFLQPLEYEQLPFQCKACHEYGNFAKDCPKTKQNADPANREEQW